MDRRLVGCHTEKARRAITQEQVGPGVWPHPASPHLSQNPLSCSEQLNGHPVLYNSSPISHCWRSDFCLSLQSRLMSSQRPTPPQLLLKTPPAPGLRQTARPGMPSPSLQHLFSLQASPPALPVPPALNSFRMCAVSGKLDSSPPAPAPLPGHQGQQLSSPAGSHRVEHVAGHTKDDV